MHAGCSHLEAPRQELVLDLQEVPPVDLPLEGLVEDGVAHVVLDVLPAGVAVSGGGGGCYGNHAEHTRLRTRTHTHLDTHTHTWTHTHTSLLPSI